MVRRENHGAKTTAGTEMGAQPGRSAVPQSAGSRDDSTREPRTDGGLVPSGSSSAPFWVYMRAVLWVI